MAPRKKKAAVEAAEAARNYEMVNEGNMGFLTHISSNIKGGVSAPLGACTAIVANRNRAGKTAVLDSIRFALTGSHPIGAHYADLCGLTIDGATPWAKLIDNTDAVAAISHIPNGKKSVAHENNLATSNVERLLPMSSVRDLLTLGTAKAREEVFRRFGGDLNAIPVPVELNDDQLELWERITNETKRNDPSEWLAAAGESIRSHKRSLSSSLKSLEEEKSRLLADTAHAGDVADQIKSLESRISVAEKAQTFAQLLKTRDEVTQQLNDEIEAFTQLTPPESAEVFGARAQKRERNAALAALAQLRKDKTEAHQSGLARLTNAQRVLALRRALAGGCIVCEAPEPSQDRQNELVTTLQGMVAALEQDLAPAQAEIEDLGREYRKMEQENITTNNREEWEWRQRVAAYENAQRRLRDLGDHYKRLDKSLSDAGVTESEDVSALPALRDQYNKLLTAQKNRDHIIDIKARMRVIEMEQADAKEVEGAIGNSLNTLLEKIKSKAEEAVNKWMPEMFRAVLQLEDTEGKPVCRWEVIGADKRAHPRNAASGAEWSALTVALACAWADGNPYKFVMLDDADLGGFSADNVENVLHMLQQAVEKGELTQVFVAWSRPNEIPRNGWTVVSP